MKAGLDAFSFTADEDQIIAVAMGKERPWDCDTVAEVKKRVKEFLLEFGERLCCYCYRDFHGEFAMVIDIEHILPKRHFKTCSFDIRNLAVSCKRCNMKMKRDNLDFLVKPMFVADIEDSAKYKLIHPNIDHRDQHLTRASLQFNAKRIVKYIVVPGSDKGEFAYDYFQLSELEVESYDSAQGANILTGVESAMLSTLRARVREIEHP